ncbi:1914_t:CDS:2, partial [Cetraspora pellucida]
FENLLEPSNQPLEHENPTEDKKSFEHKTLQEHETSQECKTSQECEIAQECETLQEQKTFQEYENLPETSESSNHNNGICYTQVFTCDHYGFFKPKLKDSNKKSRNVESKKYGCSWFIHLNHNQDDDKYYISQATLHHNYPLISLQLMHISPSSCEISMYIKEEILLSKKADISMTQIQLLLVIKYGPAMKKWIIRDQKHRDDPEFSFEFELDHDNYLKYVIWAYSLQK